MERPAAKPEVAVRVPSLAPDRTKIKLSEFDCLVADLLEPAGRERRARAVVDLLANPQAVNPPSTVSTAPVT